jgi:hypothetical protein
MSTPHPLEATHALNATALHHFVVDYLPTGFKAVHHGYDQQGRAQIRLSSPIGALKTVSAYSVDQLVMSAKTFIAACCHGRPFLTATGVDEQTDIVQIARWGVADLELGFLYSADQAGQAKRYPSWEWIRANVVKYPRCALHLCGKKAVRQLLDLHLVTSGFTRIQINGRYPKETILRICDVWQDRQIIVQYADERDEWLLDLPPENLSILVDASGGNGVLPDAWPKLRTKHPVGFAGGLTPENMREQVRRIRLVAGECWWVDLESGLRADEWFSHSRLERAHRQFWAGMYDSLDDLYDKLPTA